ncbi:BLUF domain-containing protein [Hymenobacter koreensis]|uniref:BLUF domain-containing protein n=1 Tax=Hymenobacter koreensis TaxID=1084523 RepID=A0ABP8JBT7_9BACT
MGHSTLYHLVYQSSASKPLSEKELQSILAESRAWNIAHGLTGVLLHSDGDILQVLEGSADEVQYIFRKIARDVRHSNIVKLADGPIEKRHFSDWSMGFMSVAAEDYRHLTGYMNPRSPHYLASFSDNGDEDLHSLLSTFVRSETVRL